MAQRVLDRLREVLGDTIVETRSCSGDEIAFVRRSDWHRVAEFLRDDPACAFDMFVDLTGCDYPKEEERLEVWLRLYSLRHKQRICLKTRVPEDDPTVGTVTDLWKGASWFERETYDMLGVRFEGHPDLRRILLYEQFEGHPLRKDYPLARRWPLVPERDPITQPWYPRTEGR